MSRRFQFIAFISALLFGASTPASKLLLGTVNPVLLASLYYLGASLFLLPFSWGGFRREVAALRRNRKDVGRIVGAVVFGGIIGPVALLYGIRLMDATSASLLLNFETLATTFLAWLLFRDHVSRRILIASLLTLIAGILLVFETGLTLNMGGILIWVACFAWGFDNNFTATVEGVSPQTNTLIKGLVAGTTNLILAFSLFDIDVSLRDVGVSLTVGGLAYGFSISLYITAARAIGATRSQIIFASNPFLGALLSWLVFMNTLDLRFFTALGIMLLAVGLLFFERHRHEHEHGELEHEHEHSHDDGHHSHRHAGTTGAESRHSHLHRHERQVHSHLHYPDIHHQHDH
jgi:drug/metabolite transporter (DMT)-like permease